MDFNRAEDRHLFGDIYEQILRDLQSAGNAGEYYTLRAVTQFMVDMVDPKLGEKFLDPAWWHKREKNERAWKVSIDEIKAGGYNLDIKNPSVVNNAHRDPEELLAEYRALLAGIAQTRDALKNELNAALEVKNS